LVVARKPRVAVLTTGDELVEIHEVPGLFQIRNSNAESIAAQVTLQLAEAVVLGNAKDSKDALRAKVLKGLEADMLILSGGVSMGKYDLVEPVLRELGAEIVFDAVAIRPGKPTVLAVCQGKPVFGLPGNPVSTMVTFDLFVPPALDILAGADEPGALPFTDAILTEAITEKPGLTHFLPAKQMWPGSTPRVTPVVWQGSGDVAAMTRANCLLVVPAERERIEAGERVQVLPGGLW
jgi:molybdopterin molybdotransferase